MAILLCYPSTNGAARIFLCYSLFCLLCNKLTQSSCRNEPLGERARSGVPEGIGAHIWIFSKQKKSSLVLSQFEPWPHGWQASASSILLCLRGDKLHILIIAFDLKKQRKRVFIIWSTSEDRARGLNAMLGGGDPTKEDLQSNAIKVTKLSQVNWLIRTRSESETYLPSF